MSRDQKQEHAGQKLGEADQAEIERPPGDLVHLPSHRDRLHLQRGHDEESSGLVNGEVGIGEGDAAGGDRETRSLIGNGNRNSDSGRRASASLVSAGLSSSRFGRSSAILFYCAIKSRWVDQSCGHQSQSVILSAVEPVAVDQVEGRLGPNSAAQAVQRLDMLRATQLLARSTLDCGDHNPQRADISTRSRGWLASSMRPFRHSGWLSILVRTTGARGRVLHIGSCTALDRNVGGGWVHHHRAVAECVLYGPRWEWSPAALFFLAGVVDVQTLGSRIQCRPTRRPSRTHPWTSRAAPGYLRHTRSGPPSGLPGTFMRDAGLERWDGSGGLLRIDGCLRWLPEPIMIRLEDRELEQRFGEEYQQYKRKTPAVVPRVFLARHER